MSGLPDDLATNTHPADDADILVVLAAACGVHVTKAEALEWIESLPGPKTRPT
jgi:hypothetical protein